MSHSCALALPDESATIALGSALARAVGDAVVYFHGELGTGKTTCIRSLLRTLGVTGPVRSPTYTLVEIYPLTGITCVHVDLYRLQAPDEAAELGLEEYLDGAFLLLVEWPERGAGRLPPADLEVRLAYSGAARSCGLRALTPRGLGLLLGVAHDTSLTSYVSNLT